MWQHTCMYGVLCGDASWNQQLPTKTSNTECVFLMFDHSEVQCVIILSAVYSKLLIAERAFENI